jgi:two-component system, OmpR family, phosphate regulon response regulator PhoB
MSKVLVADDDADIRTLVALRLRYAGYEVVEAEDGERALELVATEHPQLCVLDVTMPKIDGLEVTRRLRANAETEQLPVILLTARAQSRDLSAGIAAGANDYMPKPFRADDLIARVKAELEGRV